MATKEELLQQLHEASAAGDDAKVQAIAKQLLALQPAPYQSPGADPNANPWDQYVHYNQNLGQSPSDYIRNITAKGGKPTPQDLANLAIAFPSAIVEGGVNAAIQGVQGTADAAAGKIDPMDPRNRDWAVGTSLGVAGLAGTGGLSAAVEGPGAVLGAGATRRAPSTGDYTIPAYHGTNATKIKNFKADSHFASDPDVGSYHAQSVYDDEWWPEELAAGKVHPSVYPVNLKNGPYYDFEDRWLKPTMNVGWTDKVILDDIKQEHPDWVEPGLTGKQILEKRGYLGLKYNDDISDTNAPSYMVFDPKKAVKSQFDPSQSAPPTPSGDYTIPAYHGTTEPGIARFDPWSHFGTAQAAEEAWRSKNVGIGNLPKDFPKDWWSDENFPQVFNPPLTSEELPQFRSQLDDKVAAAPPSIYPVLLKDGKYFKVPDLTKEGLELDEEGVLAYLKDEKPSWVKPGMTATSILNDHGYIGLKYTNKFEDPGSTSYVVFDPQHVKSKWEPVKGPDDTPPPSGKGDVDIGANKDPVVAGLFSTADQAVAKSAQSKATGAQWLGWMKKQPGVKPEELDWRGVTDALTAAGNKPITREELQGILDQNKVQINEVVKGGESEGPDEDLRSATEYLRKQGDPVEEMNPRAIISTAKDDGWTPPASTKYAGYQIPGGENYREILLTTPTKAVAPNVTVGPTANGKGWVFYSDGENFGAIGNPADRALTEAEALQVAKQSYPNSYIARKRDNELAAKGEDPRGVYQSSHWDEPNVLVHARVNDRYIDPPTWSDIQAIGQKMAKALNTEDAYLASGSPAAAVKLGAITPQEAAVWSRGRGMDNEFKDAPGANGLKTLNAEEIQSDWHQAGRKQGYGTTPTDGWTAKPSEGRLGETLGGQWKVYDKGGNYLASVSAKDEASAVQRAAELHQPSSIPDAPFKTTWPDLMLKRLMHEAVDKGYDAISWTDGATQTARYDLSKQVTNIQYDLETGRLQVFIPGQREAYRNEIVPKDKLPNYIGKEAADRLINNPSKTTPLNDGTQDITRHTLSGAGLKVGGEGMTGFYDKILPAKATKLWGKYGAKVEDMPVGSSTETTSTALDAIDFLEEQGFSRNQLEDQSNADNVRMATDHGWEPNTETSKYGVHVIRITPEMREAIKNGQSLFARGGAVKKHKDDEPEEPRRVAGLDPHMAARYGLEMPPAGVDPITTANSPLASPDVDRYDPDVQSFNERWPEVPTQTLDPEVARKALERRQWAQMFGDVNGFLSGPMLDIDQALNSKRH